MKNLALIACTLSALGAAGLGHVYFQRLEAEVSGGPKVAVLVAAEDVPVGAALTEKRVGVRDVPQAYVEQRAVRASEVKKILGARVAGGLKTGDAVLWTDVAKFSDHARVLSGLVEQGLRAIPIDNRSADFEGLLRPGDRVDVLLTSGKGDDGSTTTLIQNVLALSVGGNIQRAEDEESTKSWSGGGTSVTVSVTMAQAQLLTQAQQRGRLTLTLRNPDDIALVDGLMETTAKDVSSHPESASTKLSGAKASKEIDHVR